MSKSKTKKIKELLLPILEEEQVELFDILYTGPARKAILRILIDKEGGVSIADCTRISKKLSLALDVKDIIHHHYTFEVSSPGIERPLRTRKHFTRNIGKTAKIKTYNLIENQRVHIGKILDFHDDIISMEVNNQTREIPFEKVSKANLHVEDFGL